MKATLPRRQLLSADDAVVGKVQHTTPCADCPWSRKALPGWLGILSAEDWVQAAHGEANIECHVQLTQQCAGAAIYRANVFKSCRDPSILRLPKDQEAVFASPAEFKEHHDRRGTE